MSAAIPFLGLVLTALSIWAIVRYFNCEKKPSARLLIGLALLAVVGYVLSFGPVYWLSVKIDNPTWYWTAANDLFAPLYWMQKNGPPWVRDSINWYCLRWINAA